MKEVVCAGFGGQGVLTTGLILSDIAIHNGQNTTWMPSYGSAMRGGTANCTVKYGKDTIYNPCGILPYVHQHCCSRRYCPDQRHGRL